MTVEEVYKYINVYPGKGAKPVFWGTGITPEHIIKDLSTGMDEAEILKQHPQLSGQHIRAAIVYFQAFPSDDQMLIIALRGILLQGIVPG